MKEKADSFVVRDTDDRTESGSCLWTKVAGLRHHHHQHQLSDNMQTEVVLGNLIQQQQFSVIEHKQISVCNIVAHFQEVITTLTIIIVLKFPNQLFLN